ncbi:MAG: DMT family transporter [Rhodobacteraceae bacterium]|jgi:drug/metabolite transporter (DMT)-like permease|nr:DMT family transporter [Paracoccaceae bacterium]
MARAAALPFAVLLGMGALWGLTPPLTKIAVSTGHGPLGLAQWVAAIDAVLLGLACLATGRRLPLTAPALRLYAVVAAFGMLLPQLFSYSAAPHLPAGVLALIVSLVPLFALPLSLALGLEGFRPGRAAGVLCGMGAMALLLAPGALPEGAAWAFVLLAACTPACYALEGTYVAGWGRAAADPVQTLTGASIVTLTVVTPLALATGTAIAPLAPWGPAEAAVVASALLSVGAYTAYVWLVGLAGAVFAAQVSYIVTGFGVASSMAMLGEGYPAAFWGALALLFAGLFLVQPRPAVPRGRFGARGPGGA